jgi:hypothetical protein
VGGCGGAVRCSIHKTADWTMHRRHGQVIRCEGGQLKSGRRCGQDSWLCALSRASSAAKSKGSGPPKVPLSTTPAASLARVLRYRGPTARRRRLCFDWHPLPVASPWGGIAHDEQLAATLSRGFRRPHAAGPCRPIPSARVTALRRFSCVRVHVQLAAKLVAFEIITSRSRLAAVAGCGSTSPSVNCIALRDATFHLLLPP